FDWYMTVSVVTLRPWAASVRSAAPGSRSVPAPTAAPAARADCARKRRRLIGVAMRPVPFDCVDSSPRHTTWDAAIPAERDRQTEYRRRGAGRVPGRSSSHLLPQQPNNL